MFNNTTFAADLIDAHADEYEAYLNFRGTLDDEDWSCCGNDEDWENGWGDSYEDWAGTSDVLPF